METEAADALVVEQISRVLDGIGGGDRYRRDLSQGGLIDRQWATLAEDGWHGLLRSDDLAETDVGLSTLCKISELLGKGLIVAPLANAAIARFFVGSHLTSQSLPIILLDTGCGGGLYMPALSHVTHVAIIDLKAPGTAMLGKVTPATLKRVEFPEGALLAFDTVSYSDTTRLDVGRTLDALSLCYAAELVGLADAAFRQAVDYLKVRKQFGRPLGSFQALQHRAANNAIAIEEARSLVAQSAKRYDRGSSVAGLSAAAICKSLEVAIEVCSSCIQMFGAIGFTAEHDAGLYLKRAMQLSRLCGFSAVHKQRFTSSWMSENDHARPQPQTISAVSATQLNWQPCR